MDHDFPGRRGFAKDLSQRQAIALNTLYRLDQNRHERSLTPPSLRERVDVSRNSGAPPASPGAANHKFMQLMGLFKHDHVASALLTACILDGVSIGAAIDGGALDRIRSKSPQNNAVGAVFILKNALDIVADQLEI